VSGLPHTERRNQIVDCRVRIEPEGSYGSFGFAAHTIVEATEDEDSETKFDIGEYSVDYVSSSLRGVSAEGFFGDHEVLNKGSRHIDLGRELGPGSAGNLYEPLQKIQELCRTLNAV